MSIFKNKENGRYYVQVMRYGKYHRLGEGFDKKEDAKRAEAELKSKLKSGQPMSAKYFIDLWIDYMKESEQFNGKAWFNVKRCIGHRYFEKWFGRSVESITASEIMNHLIERKTQCSARSANLDFELLKTFFNFCEQRGYLERNPFRQGLKKFPVDTKEKEIPSTDTIEKLINATEGPDRLLMLLLTYTMARVGEIKKLTWDDVDLDRRVILLRTRKTRTGKEKVREIPIGSRLYDALQAVEQRTGPVLQHDGKPYVDLRERMKKILKQAGVEGKPNFHGYRHYGISTLLKNKVDLTTVRDLAGHSSLLITDTYAHSQNETKLKAIATLDSIR